jgi:hypothetical protein
MAEIRKCQAIFESQPRDSNINTSPQSIDERLAKVPDSPFAGVPLPLQPLLARDPMLNHTAIPTNRESSHAPILPGEAAQAMMNPAAWI